MKQSRSVQDARDKLNEMSVSAIGVSPDVPFRFLSDPDHIVALAYGVWGENRCTVKNIRASSVLPFWSMKRAISLGVV
jgi:peroxiredoxin